MLPFTKLVGLLFIRIGRAGQFLARKIAKVAWNEAGMLILIGVAAFMFRSSRISILLVVAIIEVAWLTSRSVKHRVAQREGAILISEIAALELNAVVTDRYLRAFVASDARSSHIYCARRAADSGKGRCVRLSKPIGKAIVRRQPLRCGGSAALCLWKSVALLAAKDDADCRMTCLSHHERGLSDVLSCAIGIFFENLVTGVPPAPQNPCCLRGIAPHL